MSDPQVVNTVLGIGVGLAIRHNIKCFDTDRQGMVQHVPVLAPLERFANIALAISYVISVAFYIILLSAFTLEAVQLYSTLGVRALSTAVLVVIATSVYIIFVWLVGPLTAGVDTTRETAIIAIISKLAVALGLMLSVGAVASQFSAAVADTVGTGGIVVAESRGRFPERRAYVVIIMLAIVLLWPFDVFVG